jgi:hypothetical protein
VTSMAATVAVQETLFICCAFACAVLWRQSKRSLKRQQTEHELLRAAETPLINVVTFANRCSSPCHFLQACGSPEALALLLRTVCGWALIPAGMPA